MRAPLFALLLAACGNAADAPARQISLIWPQGHRLYVADSRRGVVMAFSTYDGPRAAAEGWAPGRGAVLDMKLDDTRRHLWVLGPQAIYEHDALSLTLLHRYPLTGATPNGRLQLDVGGGARVIAGR
jgi:hypothetical protein